MNKKDKQKAKALGLEAEIIVKNKLWRYGYNVKHFPWMSPFDLLVDDKYKVEVKCSSPKESVSKKNIYWSVYDIDYDKIDILAIVLFRKEKRPLILFYDEWRIKALDVPLYNIHFNQNNPWRIKIGTKSPYDVFGKPQKKIRQIIKKEK